MRTGITGELGVVVLLICSLGATVSSLDIAVPLGLPKVLPVPEDNPLTPEKIEIGRRLFFDPILSKDGTTSCSTCHVEKHGFAGEEPIAIGIRNIKGRRNAPTILNRAFGKAQFWDGRAATLEEQALMPIQNEIELGTSLESVIKRINESAEYLDMFEKAFSDGVTANNLAKAIACFERTLLSGNSPVDKFMAGEFKALSEPARRGKWLFDSRGKCWQCHSGANFTDENFHNTGASWNNDPVDLGLYETTQVEEDKGKFKTPTLRDVARTFPYMHDGSMKTLREVVEFYKDGGRENPNMDELVQPMEMSEQDILDLVAFLEALTGEKPGELK